MSDGQILRTGVLFKKGSGTGPFGRKNWKPRYFVLTPARLQYFTFEDGELKGELSLQGCDEGVLEVMPADSMKTGSSASTIWRIAINAPERRLLVAAGTEMEMNDWVDKLVLAFRINSGQPMQRASMPAPASDNNIAHDGRAAAASIPSVNSNPSIRDFQNFSVPRRGINQRHSVGADVRPSAEEHELQIAQAESMKQQQLEEQRRAEQDAEMRRQLAAQQQREQEEELARQQEEAAHEAALAAAEELQLQEEQEKRAQREREMQRQKELEMQQAMELQRAREAEEAARLQQEQEQEAIRNSRLAHELAVQEKLKPQQGEDLLELQRRQKREEHARERAEREKALRLRMQQEQEDLAFRMTQQMNSHFSVDDESDDSDYEPEASPSSPLIESGSLDASAHAPATAPRSSLVGDAKREMIQKQQQEHQRRREAALKQEQRERDAEWRQQQVEMEQQRAKMAALNVREAPREVEVAPREIEVVRRAPVKKPTPMESFEF
ncbi:hypothetical protein PHYSODRAFT_562896 [Phytophthora sojae]|uniref:PH domain-containing protein n=1 Tax=Phytophthora sojae (strain P6497) TaxID=1094619 RepID=G4ZXV7_PHYSP|nr:hypothetical protein PHYSODRAFT_562896 [Phytophthora sojae]EGZ11915.1 hypothetical protein PHYSODRAFT_562896 [Phytophthora sojae]|eukprot:XP_009532248.1 hypothetical protein PHYSODRAFT_562896 [Phytophthora sojae]